MCPFICGVGVRAGGHDARAPPPYDAGPDFTSKIIQFSQKWIMLRNALNFKGQGIQKLYTRREKNLNQKAL